MLTRPTTCQRSTSRYYLTRLTTPQRSAEDGEQGEIGNTLGCGPTSGGPSVTAGHDDVACGGNGNGQEA